MDRYLRERGYTHSVLKSREFSSSKTSWKEKHELFAKMEREEDEMKVHSSLVLSSNKSSSLLVLIS